MVRAWTFRVTTPATTSLATLTALETLVNNAGVMLTGSIEDAPIDEWDRMIQINIQGLLYVTHAALPIFCKPPRARVRSLTLSTSAPSLGAVPQRQGVYNLTKHGVGAFAESLRQEVSERHVRVSLIEPGVVRTELFSLIRPKILAASGNVFGANMQMLLPEDVAEAITFS